MNHANSRLLAGLALTSLLHLNGHAQAPAAAPDDAAPRLAPNTSLLAASEIDPAQFDTLFTGIKPSAAELRWLEIPWLGTLREGRSTAASAKKPMFLWAMNGHPLGTC